MSFSLQKILSPVQPPNFAQSVVLWLLAAIAAVEVAHVVALQIATFEPMPWMDEWDTFYLFNIAEKSPGTGLGFLFFPHNEHRIAIPRLISLLDMVAARGTGALNLAMVVVVPALTTAVLWSAVRWRQEMPLVLTGCIACLLFSGGQMSNFMWGFQTQVVLLYFFSLLAFCFTGKAIETKQGGRYFGACACAVCASLCQAAGLLVFPAIILLAAWHWRRAGRAGLLAIAGVTVLMAAFYVWGPGGRLQSSAALVSMPGQGLFALSFLGSPLAAIAPQLVIPAGVIATGLSVLLIVRYTKIATPRLDETVAVAICLFVPTIAAAAAVSRISLGMADATESRFVTPALFLWCGLLVGFWPFLTHRSAALCALAVAAYSLLSHLWLPYDYLPLRDLKANGEIAYVAGVKDANRLSVLGNLDRIWAVRPFLLRHGLAPFSTAVSQAVGRRLSDVYQPMPALCLGQLDGVLEPVEGNEGYRLYGWALADNGRAPEAVLLVQHDVVVGMGRFVQDRPDVMASVDRAKELKVGFIGAVRDLSDPVKAYVVNRGRACPLGGEVSDRSMSSMRSK